MRFVFISIVILFSLISCTNINFLLDDSSDFDFLKNKTVVYLDGWDNPILKEVFFIKLGEASGNRFLLTAEAIQKQTKRSVDENQVAKKIDYKIIINYSLSDTNDKCTNILNNQTSDFSFTPKSFIKLFYIVNLIYENSWSYWWNVIFIYHYLLRKVK